MEDGEAGQAPVAYDGDQKLLAFLGAVALLLGTLFWALLGTRLALGGWGSGGQGAPAAAAFAVAGAGALFLLPAWGLRTKMQRGLPVKRADLRLLSAAGLVVGVALGLLPYLILRFKLEDPDFLHLASEPENLPPALR